MGVKSLWELLKPVGRPVPLETMEGKTMAIDSSIWIYQFQATMRDKEGRALVNAHVLGFLRRICKLLFYGIKPVFVFDGGAPVLKRNTISDRKKKKSGAAANHAKVAERLLAAQMRREALNHAQAQQSAKSKGKGKAPAGPVTIDENTVYLEDLDSNAPKTPARKAGKDSANGPSPGSSSKKNRWHDHDPYRLPEVNLEERVAKATSTRVPDPRLATEEELRNFIEEMRPEDFDVTSPAFRELPTEVQYEIIGDLRLKSRQTSYKRLQNMLKNSQTPLDFSKEQIKNLRQRNTLTQQLLITNDTIGQAHVSIPVRIASERNREYVLIKNEGAEGGWVLGIRDEGTQAKPIQIDHEEEHKVAIDDEDDDMEMEEVAIPKPADVDPDLREFRRGMALAGIAKRHTPKRLGPRKTSHPKKKPKTQPLFELEEDGVPRAPQPVDDEQDDPELALAMQASLEDEEDAALRRALEASRMNIAGRPSTASTSSSASVELVEERVAESSDGDDLYMPAGRLETALAIANAGPTPKGLSMSRHPTQYSPQSPMFGRPTGGLLGQPTRLVSTAIQVSESDEDMEEVPVTPLAKVPPPLPAQSTTPTKTPAVERRRPEVMTISDSEDDMEEVVVPEELPTLTQPPRVISEPLRDAKLHQAPQLERQTAALSTPAPARGFSPDLELESYVTEPVQDTPVAMGNSPASSGSRSRRIDPSVQPPSSVARPAPVDVLSDSDGDALSGWSRSPSPEAGPSTRADGQQAQLKPHAAEEEWDAAQEMDTHAEEGEFARFMSQVKGKDLDAMRREIDDEIKALNQQKKAAMRDSEDITQHMISQIMVMLRLFGIPYITAPMEAEAQCAALVKLGLVEGIITDDSDVFLFGGLRVFKNMFNQSKTVECFLLSDLSRELGLEQDKLIQLAYLLGSDYVEGLPGVGPVVAMELLKEFPGHDGLHKFQDWWQKVQSGRDRPEDNKSKFRQRFKKKFKDLYLPADWPNPAVRDAYYHPTVDESEEPFKWGLPDLDGLRNLFLEELGWSTSKVEELLLPIIQKMNKRNQAQALNKQGNLNEYFDVAAGGSSTYAPRKRQAYASKRLQQVVSDFRKQQRKSTSASPHPDDVSSGSEDEYQESSTSSKAKAKGKKTATSTAKKSGTTRGRGRGAGRGRGRGRGRGAGGASGSGQSRKRKRGDASETESADSSDDDFVDRDGGAGQSASGTTSRDASAAPQTQPKPKLRPRPRPAYRGARGVADAGTGGVAEDGNGDAGSPRNGVEHTGSG
ncbi:PIN domain-like protein [Dentipellis sp. KUC8613]|nr:PIN domain-like protein [Dentipellis sp. KUC8613]